MICSNCGKEFNNDYDFCPYCGEKAPGIKVCPDCGFESFEYSFCPRCGIPLIIEEELEDERNEILKEIYGGYEEIEDSLRNPEIDGEFEDFLAITSGKRSYSNFEELINLKNYNNVTVIELPNKHKNKTKINLEKCYSYAENLRITEEPEEAIEYYDKLIKLNPKRDYFYSGKGDCLEKLGRYNEALQCYNKAIKLNPKYNYNYIFKADCLEKLGRYNEALQCYNKAIEIDPNYEYSYVFKKEFLRKSKNTHNNKTAPPKKEEDFIKKIIEKNRYVKIK